MIKGTLQIRRRRRLVVASWVALLIGTSGARAIDATEDKRPEAVPQEQNSSLTTTSALLEGRVTSSNMLDDAQRLSLKFQGFPDLTGEYRINADKTVSILVIGRVKISGLSAQDLEHVISERLASVTGHESFATVEIAEYRPIFVTGYVSRPGSSAWQPGLTVLQAVAMSGGVYRAADRAGTAVTPPVEAERTRILRVSTDLKFALAALARVRAEQRQEPSVATPSELTTLVGTSEADELIRAQRELLVSRRAAFDTQVTAFDHGAALATEELRGLQAQADRMREVLRARKLYRQSLNSLLSNGVIAATRGLEEDIRVTDLEEKSTNISVAIASVQAAAAGLQRDSLKLKLERATELESETQRLEHDVAQLKIELNSARQAYTRLTGEIAPSSDRTRKLVIEYAVVRQDSNGSQTAPATETSSLKPGDVLVVNARETD